MRLFAWLKRIFHRGQPPKLQSTSQPPKEKPLLEVMHDLQRELHDLQREREDRRKAEWPRRRAEIHLEIARQRPHPKPSARFFKPRPGHERRLWNPRAKPEETD